MSLWVGGLRGGRQKLLSTLVSFSSLPSSSFSSLPSSSSGCFLGGNYCSFEKKSCFSQYSLFCQKRCFSERNIQERGGGGRRQEVITTKTTWEKGKEVGFSTIFIGLSFFLVGGVVYKFVWEEYLSPDSTYSLYQQSLKLCQKNPQVKLYFGEPIELKGNIKDISSQTSYGSDGEPLKKRIQFFIQGPTDSGECCVVFKKNGKKWFTMESFDILSPRGELCLLSNGKSRMFR